MVYYMWVIHRFYRGYWSYLGLHRALYVEVMVVKESVY